jgi:hypothetical protein
MQFASVAPGANGGWMRMRMRCWMRIAQMRDLPRGRIKCVSRVFPGLSNMASAAAFDHGFHRPIHNGGCLLRFYSGPVSSPGASSRRSAAICAAARSPSGPRNALNSDDSGQDHFDLAVHEQWYEWQTAGPARCG